MQPRIDFTVEGDGKLVEHLELRHPTTLALHDHLQPVPARLRTLVVCDRESGVLLGVRPRETKLGDPRHEAPEHRVQRRSPRDHEIAGIPPSRTGTTSDPMDPASGGRKVDRGRRARRAAAASSTTWIEYPCAAAAARDPPQARRT